MLRSVITICTAALFLSAVLFSEQDALELAQSLAKAGKYFEAAALFEKAAKEEPDNEEIWREVGRCYRLSGDNKRAAEAYGKAALIIPDDPYVHIDHARSLDAVSDRISALDAYGRAVTAFTKLIATETNAAKKKVQYKDLGNVYFDMEQFPKAEEAFKEAIKVDPSYALGYNNLSAVYMKYKKYADAISALSTAYDLDPANTKPLLNLILVYAYLKDAAKSEAYAAKALAAKTPYPHFVHLYRAILYANTGDKAAWMMHLAEAFKVDTAKPLLDYRDDIATEHGFDVIRADADFVKMVKGRFGQQ
ncbi:MAG: tetratricopeptide repeat protein [Spirochaetota bacterium]